jgi:fructokinase
MRILSVGEIIWDIVGQQEFLGGAPLNFALNAVRLGNSVAIVSGIGADERGDRVRDIVSARGLDASFLFRVPDAFTGTAEVQLDGTGAAQFVIRHPAAYDFVALSDGDVQRIVALAPQWLYFGTLFSISEVCRASLERLRTELPNARRFYDVNLREHHWTAALVRELLSMADVVKLNADEVHELSAVLGFPDDVEGFARACATEFGSAVVCVTLGENGCSLLYKERFVTVPGFRVRVADTIGSGDAFAAALLHGLNEGWDADGIGRFANAVGAVVASRSGANPEWTVEECKVLVRGATISRC